LTSLRLSRLPPIAQDGANAADASGAESVLLASAEPARAGVAVRLQQRTASGWRTLGRSTTDGYGFAQFRAPQTSVQGRSPDLRVVSRATPRVRSSGTVTDDWRLTFSDEFAGSTLGAKWDYRALGVLSGSSRRRVSASSKEAVRVRDGTLRLQVRADPRRKGHYLNGHIGTERAYSFRYGIAAARIRFQRPRGTHGAFWSQSPTVNDFPGDPARAGTEIDIGEYFGDGYPRGGMASYVYHYDKGGTNRKDGDVLPRAVSVVGSADSFWTRFHVYSVEWSPEGYVFRIDGRVTYRTNTAVSARTQYLVLSLLSSDWELPDLDKRLLPATMLVDWVRVWQRSG
jgi:beta-glucanase (GH16 family)